MEKGNIKTFFILIIWIAGLWISFPYVSSVMKYGITEFDIRNTEDDSLLMVHKLWTKQLVSAVSNIDESTAEKFFDAALELEAKDLHVEFLGTNYEKRKTLFLSKDEQRALIFALMRPRIRVDTPCDEESSYRFLIKDKDETVLFLINVENTRLSNHSYRVSFSDALKSEDKYNYDLTFQKLFSNDWPTYYSQELTYFFGDLLHNVKRQQDYENPNK